MTQMNGTEPMKYRGRYQGVVRNSIDPLNKGRLLVAVPEVLGNDPCVWAAPSTPMATLAGGGVYMRGLEGAGVLVEFLDGNLDYPLWTGFWRGDATLDTPIAVKSASPKASVIVLATSAKNSIVIDDTPVAGGITLKVGLSEISLTEKGITLKCGASSIELTPAGQVSVNGPALTVL
ncbi:phage baseplate assembly protein V [Allokutzneria multivorans]|uniref:Phage baseplate assembly protein V n=1 Tax=Allokutzneria multivorans TaxID=1142134 RepID=A0ABP7S2K8_9PSEU